MQKAAIRKHLHERRPGGPHRRLLSEAERPPRERQVGQGANGSSQQLGGGAVLADRDGVARRGLAAHERQADGPEPG